jgi:hypothetical protein
MKNAVFSDAVPCGFCKSQRFGRTITCIIRVKRISVLQLKMEAIRSSETVVLHSHRCEDLKSLRIYEERCLLGCYAVWLL